MILDCDVHQGDGTASILTNDSNIFTCSIHCAENYPAKKAVSDLDFPISKGSNDDDYLAVLACCLRQIDQSNFSPDLVLYDAAVDVHSNDKLGLLNLTSEGIYERDKVVLSHFKKKQVQLPQPLGVEKPRGVARDTASSFGFVGVFVALALLQGGAVLRCNVPSACNGLASTFYNAKFAQ